MAFTCSKYGTGHRAINIHSFTNVGFNVHVMEMKSLVGMEETYRHLPFSATCRADKGLKTESVDVSRDI